MNQNIIRGGYFFLALIVVSCAKVCRRSYGEQDQMGCLEVLTTEPGKLEAKYRSDEGNGVYFLSEVAGNWRHLLITTLQGEQLYRATSPHNKDIFVSMMGRHFLVTSRTRSDGSSMAQGYVLHSESVKGVKEALFAEVSATNLPTKYYTNVESVPAMEESFSDMGEREEALLFIEATKVLGSEVGVKGSDNPAAMAVYVMAMRLAKISKKYADAEVNWFSLSRIEQQKQRCDSPFVLCSNNHRCCASGKCPIGNKCLGLCGPKCNCWSWACGDCCYHKGCYDHDLYCKKGYFTVSCLGVWKFRCNSYSY